MALFVALSCCKDRIGESVERLPVGLVFGLSGGLRMSLLSGSAESGFSGAKKRGRDS